MMTECEYEEWFEKNFADIEDESLGNDIFISNIPRKFNPKAWTIINLVVFAITMTASFIFSMYNSIYHFWVLEWIGNAMLSISFGLIVSLLVLFYTNIRERNISYYTDVIPILKDRHDKMCNAMHECYFGADIHHQEKDYRELFGSLHQYFNTCFVVINFFRYLCRIKSFEKSFSGTIDNEKLTEMANNILEVDIKVQKEYYGSKFISDETYEKCMDLDDGPIGLLEFLYAYIYELENSLFEIKYDKKRIKEIDI